MARKQRLAHIDGRSASGTPHGVLLELDSAGKYALTITGADGIKRHATSILEPAGIERLISVLTDARNNNNNQGGN